MLAAFAGTPMDVVKSRIQMRNSPYTDGAVDCAKRLCGEGGYGIFFRGAVPRMAVQGEVKKNVPLVKKDLQNEILCPSLSLKTLALLYRTSLWDCFAFL